MGTGEGAEYIPYITTSEFNSRGTTSVITDWKTGRQVHCLSQSEALWYYVLRWRDDIADIREQYPLDNIQTTMIAEQLGFRHLHYIYHTNLRENKSQRCMPLIATLIKAPTFL